MMKRALVLLMLFGALLACAGAAQATLIQDDFEGYSVGPGVPPGWVDASKRPPARWEVVEVDGNKVLKGISDIAPPQSDALAGPYSATGWFVENCEVQVSFAVQTGTGGGIAIGQLDGNRYTGGAYYVDVYVEGDGWVPDSTIYLCEEGLSMGSVVIAAAYLPAGSLQYGMWYDLRLVSTGTTFQVWFRPASTGPWQPSDKIIEAAHDLLHPGHKSYVEGWATCWTQDNIAISTVLFDSFRFEGMPFPAAETFSDDFANDVFSLANWSQHWCALDFPTVDGSQVARVTATSPRAGAVGLGLAKQYYTHNFTLRTSMYLDEAFEGGVAWGWEGTPETDTCYFLQAWREGGLIHFGLAEMINGAGTVLGLGGAPEIPGVNWYTVEVVADYKYYRMWFWPRGEPKPTNPVIAVRPDIAHPGYRLVNLGAVVLWQNGNHVGSFDDFYFHGTPAPSVNTPEGTSVQVEPEPGLSLTFDTVSEEGAASVETSTTAPGGGPGGLEFQGLYYDINTTCVYSGPITISLTYDDTGMTLQQEESLRLMHWVTANQTWVDITVLPVDTLNNIITGVTDSLSVFAIATLPVFDGFLPPINMPPAAMSVFKQKSTIPVKFKLLDAATGAPVPGVVATIWGVRVSLGVPSGVNEAVISTQPDGGDTFRYDPTAGQYIFNLSTKNLSPGVYRIHANIMGGLMDRWVDVAVK